MAGTVTISDNGVSVKPGQLLRRIKVEWTSDSSGDANGTATDPIYGLIYEIKTVPGSGDDAPTDDYDVTLIDADGADLLGGNGADRDTANAEWAKPNTFPKVVDGAFTPTIANAGSANSGTLYIYVETR